MKKNILLVLFVSIALNLFSQTETTSVAPVKHHNVFVDLVGLGYKYEHALSERYTLALETGLKTTSIGYSSTAGNYFGLETTGNFFYSLAPFAGIEGRYYYPLKKLSYPASNFWAMEVKYFFNPVLKQNVNDAQYILVSPYWGIYRSISDNWRYELDLGLNLGSNLTAGKFAFSPKLDFKIFVNF